MTETQFSELPEAQREAFVRLYHRTQTPWSKFLDDAQAPTDLCPYIGVSNFAGMFVGIEADGYTHS